MPVLDWVKENWALTAGAGTVLVGLFVWGAKLWATRQRIRAEAKHELAKLTESKKDDIETKAEVDEARAVEEALKDLPVGDRD